MKKYIRCAYMTDDEIVQRFAEDGIDTTSNPSDAIYILQDGRMLTYPSAKVNGILLNASTD